MFDLSAGRIRNESNNLATDRQPSNKQLRVKAYSKYYKAMSWLAAKFELLGERKGDDKLHILSYEFLVGSGECVKQC
jgi:hypothetical protein